MAETKKLGELTMIESSDLRMRRIPLSYGAGHIPALGFGTLIPETWGQTGRFRINLPETAAEFERRSSDIRETFRLSPVFPRFSYGKNDPFRSWPISANELEEVAMGSETNV